LVRQTAFLDLDLVPWRFGKDLQWIRDLLDDFGMEACAVWKGTVTLSGPLP
jgi:hypothetical protein